MMDETEPTANGSVEDRVSDGHVLALPPLKRPRPLLQPFAPASLLMPPSECLMRFPFTMAQWQELERQALIYKYMMASLPVPPDLLFSICTRNHLSHVSTSDPHSLVARSTGCLRYANGAADPEPGRCRRTDGKKWRCSRDAAPDQKYCERHMHRGRPRSRKPVEVPVPPPQPPQTQSHRPSLVASATAANLPSAAAASSQIASKTHHHSSHYFRISTSETRYEPRFLDLMEANQQWQFMVSSGATTASVLQSYDEQLNLNFANYGSCGAEPKQAEQCSLYLNTDFSSFDDQPQVRQQQQQPPRLFIDAWSTATTTTATICKDTPIDRDQNLFVSSLTLSMPSSYDGAPIESQHEDCSIKKQSLNWNNPISWMSSPPPGGPLGEVLQSSAAACSTSEPLHNSSALNLLTDGCGNNSNSLERSSRPDSSPSCVLHRTLVSPSDSSSSSSPTFAPARSEVALRWFGHGKLSN